MPRPDRRAVLPLAFRTLPAFETLEAAFADDGAVVTVPDAAGT